MKLGLILLAGGTGSRFGSELPKQFTKIEGRELLLHSLERLLAWRPFERIILVTHNDHFQRTHSIIEQHHPEWLERIVITAGGDSRHGSTLNGLNALGEIEADTIILIHDAARPVLLADDLERLLQSFNDPNVGVASLVARVTETLVEADQLPGPPLATPDRNRLFAVKTPQACRGSALPAMLCTPEERGFTDLLTWARAAKIEAQLVEGSASNIKLTTREELYMIKALLSASALDGV